MLNHREIEELKNQRVILSQLFELAQASFRASELAEYESRRAKLAALKVQVELQVLLEMNAHSLGLEPPTVTTEDASAAAKAWIEDEHEQGVSA